MKIKDIIPLAFGGSKKAVAELSNKDQRIVSRVIRKQESITRKDIGDWKSARQEAERADEPKQRFLQVLYNEIMLDALMTSQIGLRIDKSQAAQFSLVDAAGKTDIESVKILADSGLYDNLSELIIESKFFGSSVVELGFDSAGKPTATLVSRKHISPATGRFYPDVSSSEYELYRNRSDYGSFILEFYPRKDDLGLLNKAIPYVLMKKFAISCWSELCEIYGIPPRVLKTNTTDDAMLTRAENMMREVGSAAYFIIDTEEDFAFAQGSSTNGDVYRNLIATCDEQISLLNIGAVLGQDTLNGNRSKEEVSSTLLDAIVEADKRYIQYNFNNQVLPALATIGVIKPGLRLEFAKSTDLEKLWEMTNQASANYDFDIAWLNETFGLAITGAKQIGTATEMRGRGKDFDFFA